MHDRLSVRHQACEHEGWDTSEAHTFVDALRRHASTRFPGYDAAEWGAPPRTAGNAVALSTL